jgi:antitoxin PrlF
VIAVAEVRERFAVSAAVTIDLKELASVLLWYYRRRLELGTGVTSKGQITIPGPIRDAARVAPGSELEWTYDPVGDRIIATKPRSRSNRGGRFVRLRGTATTCMSTEEIMARTRDLPEV